MIDETHLDPLMGLVARTLERDLGARAAEFARGAAQRILSRTLAARLPERAIVYSGPEGKRSAPLFDMAVAAGGGRELWEEECDSWIALPDDIPDSRYLALRVAGESMRPLLRPRDVILIQLDAHPAVDDIVVARRADDGYVVKRVAGIRANGLELESLNPEYESILISAGERPVLGTVVARFREL